MSDRWFNIYHFYHQFDVWQVQVKFSKSVPQFGHSLSMVVAMSDLTIRQSRSLPLTHRKSASTASQVCHYCISSLPLTHHDRAVW